MKKILLTLLIFTCAIKSPAQTNTFPSDGHVGVGTLSPAGWFPGKILEIRDQRPILKLSPLEEGGLATIFFKGAYNNTPGSVDEFHINYVSSTTQPRIVIGGYQNGGQHIFSLLGNGNLGLGIEFPNEKLAVNGNIRARNVISELDNWPDYVFEPSYKLQTLEEVKSFIDKNHHLPDIPSEKEIIEKGLNLGEISKSLMKKVEELTLYLIEKNEEQKNQDQKLVAQQIQIDQLTQSVRKLQNRLKN